uniref:Target of myb1 membrane trafficking protein n=1 Tax=Spermophilus dauricus TaxID=99837 RepID=A0A8C9QTX6_SPEDA
MDFLLGNPFSSPVGQRIEKATDGSLQGEDWALNMEICDIINETEEGGCRAGHFPSSNWGTPGHLSPSGLGNLCEELRAPLPRAGGQPGLRGECVGEDHPAQEQPAHHRARQGAEPHPGEPWGVPGAGPGEWRSGGGPPCPGTTRPPSCTTRC